MTAVYCCTRNRYEQLAVAVYSLIRHHPDAHIYLLIEDDVFPYLEHPNVTVINCYQYQPLVAGVNFHNRWTYMSLMRTALHRILSEPCVLYLDIDTIVLDDLTELISTPMDSYCIAGVAEEPMSTNIRYFNAGVLLMNLDRLRSTGLGEEWRQKCYNEAYQFPDQDTLNIVFSSEKLELSSKWNYSPKVMRPCDHPHIVHYLSIFDWTDEPDYVQAEQDYLRWKHSP